MTRFVIVLLTLFGAGVLSAPAAVESSVDSTGDVRKPLDPEKVLAALKQGLGHVKAEIKIDKLSSFPVPDGKITFAWDDLVPPSSPQAATRWRGYVNYGDRDRFSIWALVKINAECRRVVATEFIQPGQRIRAGQVREETYSGFPADKNLDWGMDDVVGQASVRPLRPDETIRAENLTKPIAIQRGMPVTAEYRMGALRLLVPVIAEQSGRVGEFIRIRNAMSRRILRALVTGEGELVIGEAAIRAAGTPNEDK